MAKSDRLHCMSADVKRLTIEELCRLFPACVVEEDTLQGARRVIDISRLEQHLGKISEQDLYAILNQNSPDALENECEGAVTSCKSSCTLSGTSSSALPSKGEGVASSCTSSGTSSSDALSASSLSPSELNNSHSSAGSERYEFSWVGKRQAILEAFKQTRNILRPCVAESVNWEKTGNLYLEGDNLEVLKLLQKSYLGKVKMIYADPPYNTGNDFIYHDDFTQSKADYREAASSSSASSKLHQENSPFYCNSDHSGRYHSSWCSMMYSRLLLARNLLRDDGVLFLSIDDNEMHNLRKMCDEIFGEDNFLACFPRVTKRSGKSTDVIAKNHDYLLCYQKTSSSKFYLPAHSDPNFKYEDEYVATRGKYKLNQPLDYDSLKYSSSLDYPIELEGEIFYPGSDVTKFKERQKGLHGRADWAWRWSKERFEFGLEQGFVILKRTASGKARIYTKTYENASIVELKDKDGAPNKSRYAVVYKERTKPISSLEFTDNLYSNDRAKKNLVSLLGDSVFDYTKPVSLMSALVQFTTRDDDLILDFFSGSATTAQAVMEANVEDGGKRNFIMVQLPELCAEGTNAKRAGFDNICDLGKERIRRAGKAIEEELEGKEPKKVSSLDDLESRAALFARSNSNAPRLNKDELDLGFRVFKLDNSNMKDEFFCEESRDSLLKSMASQIKEGRTGLDLFFGCVLEWGLDLSKAYQRNQLMGATVHSYGNGELVACFSADIDCNVVTTILQTKQKCLVLREQSFNQLCLKTDVMKNLKHISPDTVLKLL